MSEEYIPIPTATDNARRRVFGEHLKVLGFLFNPCSNGIFERRTNR
jgi:hypothetical protein